MIRFKYVILAVFSICYVVPATCAWAESSIVRSQSRGPASTMGQIMSQMLAEQPVYNMMALSQARLQANYQNRFGENYLDEYLRDKESKDFGKDIGRIILKTFKQRVEKAASSAFKEQFEKRNPYAEEITIAPNGNFLSNFISSQSSIVAGFSSFFHYCRINLDPADKNVGFKVSPAGFPKLITLSPFIGAINYSMKEKRLLTTVNSKLAPTVRLEFSNMTSFLPSREKFFGVALSYDF